MAIISQIPVETNPNTWLRFTYTPGVKIRHCKTAGCAGVVSRSNFQRCDDCRKKLAKESARQRAVKTRLRAALKTKFLKKGTK